MEKAEKSWTYSELTAVAEDKIIRLMELSDRQERPETASFIELIAYGVYDGWFSVTCGYMKQGDNNRLRALTEKPKAG